MLFALLSLCSSALISTVVSADLPSKIYGVNLGSWLVLEPWMLPNEWQNIMGGQICSDCSTCVDSEFAFAQAHPKTVDSIFDKHWSTWFTQDDVDQLVEAGINTVRIPLGYWLIEQLVDRKTEFYPRGGILQLKRGLKQLKSAGIVAILDHHALPGVQTPGQQFTGRCTQDVEFYTDFNYHRALVWTAIITTLSHLDPDFSNVVSIEAVNEPIMNANSTPGYGGFQKNFVLTVRAVELILGIPYSSLTVEDLKLSTSNFNEAIAQASTLSTLFNADVRSALAEAASYILPIAKQLALGSLQFTPDRNRKALITNFMDINWQYNNPANPRDAAIGPQGYDNHLYYSFGGVAAANPRAYMISICNLNRIAADAALGNTPLWFGEWGLPTQFTANDTFLHQWADAQKLAYSKGAGWIFLNFKVEISSLAGDLARQWSYLEGVRRGYLTKDPSKLNDPHVCDPYIGKTS